MRTAPQGRGLDSTPTALRLCVTQPFGKHVHVRASVEPFVIAPGDATCSCRWGCHCANLMWVLTFRWPRRSVCKPCNTFVFGATHCFDPKCYIPQCDYPFCCCICLPQIWNYLQASHLVSKVDGDLCRGEEVIPSLEGRTSSLPPFHPCPGEGATV